MESRSSLLAILAFDSSHALRHALPIADECPHAPHERLAFSPIEGRPPLKLPDGLRLILWPLMSLEHWDISRPMARMVITPPQGQPMLPDHPNWSWHEYGMRVGFWRLKRVFERLKMTPTVTLNGRACESLSAGDAGRRPTPAGSSTPTATSRFRCTSSTTSSARSRRRSTSSASSGAGRRAAGSGPGLTQTFDTLDYLSRGRHRIHRRLGARRRAGDAEDHAQAGGGAAVQFRAARHRDDGAAEPHLRRDSTAARWTPSNASTRNWPSARRSCRSPCIPICPASRTASPMSSAPSRKSCRKPGVACWNGEKILDWYLGTQKGQRA